MLTKTRVDLTVAVIVESEGPLDVGTFVQELHYEIESAIDNLRVINTEIRDYTAMQLDPVPKQPDYRVNDSSCEGIYLRNE